jgi:hypothetical protein
MIRRAAAIVLLALVAGCQAVAFVYSNRPSPNFDCIPGSITRPCDYITPG